MSRELIWLLSTFGGVVVAAILVNRFARADRRRLRRVVALFVLQAFAVGATLLVRELGLEGEPRFQIAAELLRVFTLVNVVGVVLFRVLFPSVRLTLPMIAGDLLVGLGYIAGTLGVLSRHGLDPSSALATGAVVSAVLAISLQTTLGNILGGVALQLDGSLHEGDYIQLADKTQGQIRAIRWRHTLVETGDHTTIVVPNSQLLATNIVLLGQRDGHPAPQRVTVDFHVDVVVSPSAVLAAVHAAMIDSRVENVAHDPQPTCVCTDFDRDGIATYTVRYFLIDPRTKTTSSRVLVRLHAALRRAGISMSSRKVLTPEDESAGYLRVIKQISLFQALTEEELHTLASTMTHVPYATGETIAHQGAVAHSLFILNAGTVEVRTKHDIDGEGPAPERSGVVATITAPNFFGEMGVMTGEPRRADVVAKCDVDCYRLKKEAVEKVLVQRPEIAKALSEVLATRTVELTAVHDNLDAVSRAEQTARERDRIHSSIRQFFGLGTDASG